MDFLCPQDTLLDVIPRECQGSIGFTLAFENYILILIPGAILLLLTPLRLRTIWSRSVKVVSPTILQAVKTLSSLCFAGFSLAILIVSTQLADPWRRSETAAAAMSFMAALVCLALSHLEHFRSVRPSILLQLYLMVAVVVEAVHLRTVWIRSSDVVMKSVCAGQLASCAVFLASESMDKESILLGHKIRSPQDINDLFSQRLFFWLNNLFVQGYRKILAPKDLFSIDEELASPETQRVFRLTWLKRHQKDADNYLYWTLLLSMKRYFLFPIIPRLLLLGVNFAQPYLIKRFVAYVGDSKSARPNEGPLLVVAAFCMYTALGTVQSWYWQGCNRFETKLRGVLIAAIHEKALRSRPSSEFSPLMLMNVDVEKTVNGLRFQHEFWAVTVAMGVALYLLNGQVGLAFIAPTILLAIIAVAVSQNGHQVAPKTKTWLNCTQTRVSFITGVIAAMKNIKLMGLVQTIQDMGTKLRQEEVAAQKGIRKAIFFNVMISQFTFQLSALVLYGTYAIQVTKGSVPPLTNDNLFSSMAILKLFTTPLLSTIQYVSQIVQAAAALSRISVYLKSEEHQDKRVEADQTQLSFAAKSTPGHAQEPLVAVLEDVVAGYSGKTDALSGFSFALTKGKLHIAIGVVGSGKSTVLKTLIGETAIKSGKVLMSTYDTSFCDQVPWLWNGSIKENILGEEEFNQGWFDQVTWACGLNEDFKQLPQGIDTKCGDDGTSLSGGQKNRISLARAVYSRQRLFIADDILSGLDSRTEALVFGRVFGPSGLLKKVGVTTLLATHSVGWLGYADQVVVVDNGSCAYQGPPAGLPSRFAPLISHSSTIKEETYDASAKEPTATSSAAPSEKEDEAQTVPRDRGIYLEYLRSFGKGPLIFFCFVSLVPQVCKSMEQIWLKWWAGAETTSPSETGMYIGVFAGIIVIDILGMNAEIWTAMMNLFPRSSLYLHAMQWAALVEVKFSAWGMMENGAVANRFSQDMTLVDMQLPNAALNTFALFLGLLAMIIIIVIATPFIAAALPVLAAVLWIIQDIYLRTSKQLRVMDLEAKAPLCRHFLETVGGVMTINAFGWSEKNRDRNIQLLEASQAPFYLLLSIQQWLQLVLDLVVAGLAIVLMSVCVAIADRLDAGYLGLALLSIMDLGQFFNYFVVSWTQFDTSLGAVARIKDFCKRMPQEEQGARQVGKDWMASPAIEVNGLTASYAEGKEPILRNVNLTIPPGTKVGICGRTGSGKSSLASALFGLLHVQDGSIVVDGVDIRDVSQDELRSKMIALPQDAYFAPGTVRENLALRKLERELTTDEMMLGALRKVDLLRKFEDLAVAAEKEGSGALDVELDPSKMLTKGQQQLFAMARTILSKGQIVMVDEATSGLDKESDDKLQELLRTEMKGKTIIAIAHRLSTIMDFDVVLVMDKGHLVEMGAPEQLKQKGGRFAELVRGGGNEPGLETPSQSVTSANITPAYEYAAKILLARSNPIFKTAIIISVSQKILHIITVLSRHPPYHLLRYHQPLLSALLLPHHLRHLSSALFTMADVVLVVFPVFTNQEAVCSITTRTGKSFVAPTATLAKSPVWAEALSGPYCSHQDLLVDDVDDIILERLLQRAFGDKDIESWAWSPSQILAFVMAYQRYFPGNPLEWNWAALFLLCPPDGCDAFGLTQIIEAAARTGRGGTFAAAVERLLRLHGRHMVHDSWREHLWPAGSIAEGSSSSVVW
ncbi:ABC transporter-like protein 11 [Elsinoe fawcettii]|nr:ABC transporter-like protein 11 [Elsinoe fawcettii]